MGDRLKKIPSQLLEIWNKYEKKQKIIIIAVAVVLVASLSILGFVLSRPSYTLLAKCETTSETSEVKTLLDENGINNKVGDGAMTIYVEKKDLIDAQLLLGYNDIPSAGYTLEDALNGGFSETEANTNRKYKKYLEEKIATLLCHIENIKAATVELTIPDTTTSILASDEETSVAVTLTLSAPLEESAKAGIGNLLKTAVGNATTENIFVIDSNANVIFSGNADNSAIGNATGNQAYKEEMESAVNNNIRSIILSSEIYDDVKIVSNLDVNFDKVNTQEINYSVPDGMKQGYYESSYTIDQTGGTTTGGVPGTTSNDEDTDYMITDGSSDSTYKLAQYKYLVNQLVTTTDKAAGTVTWNNSNISLIATSYRLYKEDEVKKSGALDNMTWDEFKVANRDKVKQDVDAELINAVSMGCGIPTANISFLAYEIPVFQDAQSSARPISFYIQIILAVLIVLMLGFVVFKTATPVAVTEEEPEISVENLLTATQEAEKIGNIDVQEKTDTRIAIEMFVDENPEAVALLLRNWLNEGWE